MFCHANIDYPDPLSPCSRMNLIVRLLDRILRRTNFFFCLWNLSILDFLNNLKKSGGGGGKESSLIYMPFNF